MDITFHDLMQYGVLGVLVPTVGWLASRSLKRRETINQVETEIAVIQQRLKGQDTINTAVINLQATMPQFATLAETLSQVREEVSGLKAVVSNFSNDMIRMGNRIDALVTSERRGRTP